MKSFAPSVTVLAPQTKLLLITITPTLVPLFHALNVVPGVSGSTIRGEETNDSPAAAADATAAAPVVAEALEEGESSGNSKVGAATRGTAFKLSPASLAAKASPATIAVQKRDAFDGTAVSLILIN
jgi:hypothetical protein